MIKQKRVKKFWIVLTIVTVCIIFMDVGFVLYALHIAKNSCSKSFMDYDVPKELYVDPKYKDLFPERQFVKYTKYCNQSDELIVNELILFTDTEGNIIPGRILEKQSDSYFVLTQHGNITIHRDLIIADD
ncbi:MAG TPA: hypothetical protein VJB65_04660 [Patescibacteria group bacterium]|nr:hypothetical protein [Patescibacteria group bacterium]